MNIEQVHTFITSTLSELLPQFIEKHGWNIETIQSLKDFSARFYFSDSAYALAIAQSAYKLGRLLPFPAPHLGEWTLANALMHHALYQQSISYFQHAYFGYRINGCILDAARLSVGYVFALVNVGEAEAALKLGKENQVHLLEASKTNPADQERLAGLLLNLAVAYERQGMYEEAIETGEMLEPLTLALNDRLLLAQTQHNRAYDLAQIGLFDQALRLYRLAEKIFLEEGATEDIIRLYINLGNLYAFLGNHQRALNLVDAAERKLADLADNSQSLHRLVLVRAQLTLLTHNAFADTLFKQLGDAQAAFEKNGPVIEAALSLILQGRGYILSNQLKNAEIAFQAAMAVHGVEHDRGIQFRAFHGLGQVAYRYGNTEEAIQYHQQAIQCIDAIRHTLYVESYRAAFMADKLNVYQDLCQILLDQGENEAAFSVIEQGKSRLVAEKLVWRLSAQANNLTRSADHEASPFAEQLRSSINQLDKLYRQIADKEQSKNETVVSLHLESNQEISRLETEVQQLIHQLQRHSPHFSGATSGKTVELQAFTKGLRDAIFLQYHQLADSYYVFVVDPHGSQFHLKLATIREVQQQFNHFMMAIERGLGLITKLGITKTARYGDALLVDVNHGLQRLYSLLLEPVLARLNSLAPLIISPQGILHYLPFHAFYNGNRYVIEDRIVSYSPSATVLDFCSGRKTNNDELLLCGYDGGKLRSIARELRQVEQILATHHPIVDVEVTAHNLLSLLPNKRLIHIAAHSSFRSDNPMLSSFSLADRRLTLAEIVQLQLETDLVVLSSCETGKGQLHGDELISLSSGFLGAGARTLLLSLWRVEDEATANIMQFFYTSLASGNSCAKSLQIAQCEILHQARQNPHSLGIYRHPLFWAPIVMLGDPNTTIV